MLNMKSNPADVMSPTSARHDRGFSLIEVLVALVVLSVGLLGLAALQSTATQFNASAYTRSQATLLAYDMADRIRANRQAGLDGQYNSPYPDPGDLPECDDDVDGTVAEQDLGGWRRALVCSLPNGNGEVEFDDPVLTIRVTWDDRDPDEPNPEFVMTTGL